MLTPSWKTVIIIVAACFLIIAGIWTGVILNTPQETIIMNSTNDWIGTEATTLPEDIKTPATMETATFALG